MAICILNLTMIDFFPDLQYTASKFCDLLHITVYSILPAGNLLHSYWKNKKYNSWFTMIYLLKMVMFQFAMLVYQRVPPFLNGKKPLNHPKNCQPRHSPFAESSWWRRPRDCVWPGIKAIRCGWIDVKQLVKQREHPGSVVFQKHFHSIS